MPNDDLRSELLSILSRHGVGGLPPSAVTAPVPKPTIGPAPSASWIKEIITSDREFDEAILARVANLLGNRK